MSEYVYYSEPQRILYRLHDSTHITQTIVGNTLVTEQPQYSSKFISLRIMQISANGLVYSNLRINQCNNFHIPNFLDFLWNSNVRKRPFPSVSPTSNYNSLFQPVFLYQRPQFLISNVNLIRLVVYCDKRDVCSLGLKEDDIGNSSCTATFSFSF